MGLSLDQARGSVWTRHGAQPGLLTALSLDQGWGSTQTRDGLNLDKGQGSVWIRDMAQPGSGTGLDLDQGPVRDGAQSGSILHSDQGACLGLGQACHDPGTAEPAWEAGGPAGRCQGNTDVS